MQGKERSHFYGMEPRWGFARWLALLPNSKMVPDLIPGWVLFVWGLHVVTVHAWVLSGYSSFLSPSLKKHAC